MCKKKSLLIVGVGSIGERHLRCFQATGRVETSILEIDPELRQRIAGEYGVRRAFATLDSALAKKHDATVIATPAHLHVPIALRLAEAGLHLLIEKPLGTGLEGIARLEEEIAQRKLVAQMAYVLRLHPSLRAMRAAIHSGRFGRPVQLVTYCGQNFPTYRPAYREIYYKDRATGGGAIQDLLAHHVNVAQWLVGPVDRVVVDAAHRVLEGVEVEDTLGVLARHGDVLGSYAMNQHQAPNELTTTVICERGTARWVFHRNKWCWMDQPDGPWKEEPAGKLARDDMFIAQANAFLDAVDGRAAPVCSLREGVETLRVCLAALKSADEGGWQTLP